MRRVSPMPQRTKKTDSQWTQLHEWSRSGSVARIREMLNSAEQAEVKNLLEERDQNGRTPLYIAAGRGKTKAVDMLLQFGADLEAKNIEGHTPLESAAYNKHDKTVKFLLEKGAFIDKRAILKYAAGKNSKVVRVIRDWLKSRNELPELEDIKICAILEPCYDDILVNMGSDIRLEDFELDSDDNVIFPRRINIAPPKAKSPSEWTNADVADWLRSLGLSADYQNIFKKHAVDGAVLLTLTKEDLGEIGVNIFGDKRKIEMAIAKLKEEACLNKV